MSSIYLENSNIIIEGHTTVNLVLNLISGRILLPIDIKPNKSSLQFWRKVSENIVFLSSLYYKREKRERAKKLLEDVNRSDKFAYKYPKYTVAYQDLSTDWQWANVKDNWSESAYVKYNYASSSSSTVPNQWLYHTTYSNSSSPVFDHTGTYQLYSDPMNDRNKYLSDGTIVIDTKNNTIARAPLPNRKTIFLINTENLNIETNIKYAWKIFNEVLLNSFDLSGVFHTQIGYKSI